MCYPNAENSGGDNEYFQQIWRVWVDCSTINLTNKENKTVTESL